MKNCIRQLIYRLMHKRIDETAIASCEIRLKRKDVSFFNLSTNPILSFWYEGELWYFRECPQILKKDAYWSKAISDFFDSLDRLNIRKEHFLQDIPICIDFDEAQISQFQRYVYRKQQEKSFKRMLENVDCISHNYFSIWEKQTYNVIFFEHFAMGDLPASCRDLAVYFLWNMRAVADNYRTQKIIRGKKYSFFAASKSMATQIVAEELGLTDLITPSKWCRVVTDDSTVRFGVLSASAPGHRMIDVSMEPSPSLQKALLNLNLLDVICYQPDHGPNNYNVYTDVQGNCQINAFDNDNAKTFFPCPNATQSFSGCSPFVVGRLINRPHLSESTAEQLQCADISRLKQRLRPYLNFLQITAVISRIHALQKAICNTKKENISFLLEDNQWNEETVKEELSGKYGQTYLSRLHI